MNVAIISASPKMIRSNSSLLKYQDRIVGVAELSLADFFRDGVDRVVADILDSGRFILLESLAVPGKG